MNHLHGLTTIADPTKDLPPSEGKILCEFRSAFEAKKPADALNIPLTHQLPSSDVLPKCGWRPLDDNTLYRFLCADRDKSGFHPDLSLKRLLSALQFRKDHRVDEILNIVDPDSNLAANGPPITALRSKAHSVDSTLSALSADTSCCSNHTIISSTSCVAVNGMSLMVGTYITTTENPDSVEVEIIRSNSSDNSIPTGSGHSNNKQKAPKAVTFNKQAEVKKQKQQQLKKQDSFTSMATATTAVSSSSRSTILTKQSLQLQRTMTSPPSSPSSLSPASPSSTGPTFEAAIPPSGPSLPPPPPPQQEEQPPPSIPRPPSVITPAQLEKYQRLRVRVFVGKDRQGNPVMFERLGGFFGSGGTHDFTMEEWITLYIWDLERHFVEMRKAAIETQKPIQQYVFFGDLDHVLRSVLTGKIWSAVPLMTKLAKTVEQHYPEIVSHVVVYNVPKVASAVVEVFKKVMDPVTAAKLHLSAGLPKQLALQLIDEDCLPEEYGGRNTISYPKTSRH